LISSLLFSFSLIPLINPMHGVTDFNHSIGNSTSCLVKNKAESIAVANAGVVPPRHSSTEGRFSILDSHAKSSDSESDFDTNQTPITFSHRVFPVPNFSKSVDFSAGAAVLPMSASVSRFRIVPLESRYKRGRWTCFDYYEKSSVTRNAKLSLPASKNKSFDINNLSVRSLNEVRFAFDLSSDEEGEIDVKRVPLRKEKPSPPSAASVSVQQQPISAPATAPAASAAPAVSSSSPSAAPALQSGRVLSPPASLPALITTEIRPDETKILSAVKASDLGMTLSLNNGRLTPTEMLQSGLENTLNTCSEAIIGALVQEKKVVAKKKSSSSASTASTTGGNPSMVAIDSKIEQAMDLVKTHLMFAVREEVEVLRGRIVDLENTVCNLEAENAVLRKHVSEEILRNMQS
ncbi:hypothetical protein PMAYCL1PPCAC_02277, partial [Pristionchus mayeri]